MINQTTHNISRTAKGLDGEIEQSRRHIERLLLRLDFNGELSKPRNKKEGDILADLGNLT
jgi:gamma-tubulin complex component 4